MNGKKAGLLNRLNKEKQELENSYADTFKLKEVDLEKLIWHITFKGAESSLYAREEFTLQFRFLDNYPFVSPEVKFIGAVPIHEHILSCGYICLSTLDKDWSQS